MGAINPSKDIEETDVLLIKAWIYDRYSFQGNFPWSNRVRNAYFYLLRDCNIYFEDIKLRYDDHICSTELILLQTDRKTWHLA